ncbi:MAG TPA: hypothetical protein VHC96_24920 [Puia sp.]|jgi:hypothetical protein|nr:hypothetical protein [Puia sp.]
MEEIQAIGRRIQAYNNSLDRSLVRKVLILYEEKVFFIGDTCLRFDKFRFCRLFFEQATVELNISNNESYLPQYNALLKNNPYLDGITFLSLKDIHYDQYDVVVCVIPDEGRLLQVLHDKYAARLEAGAMSLAVFSLSAIYINQERKLNTLPGYDALIEFYHTCPDNQLHEVYITSEERAQAVAWLEANGMTKKDDLFIFLDSSAKREKLLRMDVYFSILKTMLDRPHTRVLIFDEKGIGKEEFYREWLGRELASKLIFSKKLPLREDLALLGSKYTKLIFGPCTGLLHCAAGIYNHFVKKGMPVAEVPVMITYTGKYTRPGENAAAWWDACPLVSCLLLKQFQGTRQICELSTLSREEKVRTDNVLPCKEYTSDTLLPLIARKLERSRTACLI